jgi:mRNA deadenylase 3'-5' endonuclease subunit Ccr4
MNTKNIREQIAAIQHQQWSGWMNYMFSKCTNNLDGTYTIPEWAVFRWYNQIMTPYHKLTDKEQESDRVEADKILQLIEGVCEDVIGESEEVPLTRLTAEAAEMMGGVTTASEGRNRLKEEQRQRLSQLLGEPPITN